MSARAAIGADDFGVHCLGIGLVGALIALLPATGPAALPTVGLVLALLTARVVIQDLTDFTIPDSATLAIALVAAAWRLSEGVTGRQDLAPDLALVALDGALCGGALLILREAFYRRRGFDGMGLGDVKLGAAGGILVGTGVFAWALLAASLVGILVMSGRRLRLATAQASDQADEKAIEEKLAFGALLAPALWLAWLATALGLDLV